jgi:hypothetical protein
MNEQVAALRGEVKAMQQSLREHYERTGDAWLCFARAANR